jgi:signal transduction histidine kinase
LSIQALGKSVAVRLWLWLTAVTVLLVGAHLYLVRTERRLATSRYRQGEQLARVLGRLLLQEMEEGHPERFPVRLQAYMADSSILALQLIGPGPHLAFLDETRARPSPALKPCGACHGQRPAADYRFLSTPSDSARILVAVDVWKDAVCARCHPRDERHHVVLHLAFSFREELAQANAVRRRLALAGGAVLLLTLGGMAGIIHAMVRRPLERLLRGVRRLEEGDLSTRVPEDMPQEFGALSRAFNAMASRLQEIHERQQRIITVQAEELARSQATIIHQEKLAGLGVMAAGIAHEIGNPLASVSAVAQLLERRIQDPSAREQVQLILRHIDRISRIVRDLSDFSRAPVLRREPTQVNEVLKAALALLRHDRRFREVGVVQRLDPRLPRVELIPDHLLQVFFNLGLNAMEAMGGQGQLEVSSWVEHGAIQVRFRDTGPGIPPEHRSRIFEPFFTTKPTGEGTGLGLSVSYGLMRSLGGDLILEETSSKGSSFLVIIPLETRGEAAGPEPEAASSRPARGEEEQR